VLIELGVVEQRHQAVLEVLGGLCVTACAAVLCAQDTTTTASRNGTVGR